MNFQKGLLAVVFFIIFLVPIISVAAPIPIPVSKVSSGEGHTLILTEVNTVWGCGDNQYRQLGDGTNINRYIPTQVYDGNMNTDSNCLENIIEIAAGLKHSLAMDINHQMWAWGDNDRGELGIGNQYDDKPTPVQVHGGEQGAQFLKYIIGISAGRSGEHSLAVDANHFCFSFGRNESGQLGNGKGGGGNDSNLSPIRVHGINGIGCLADCLSSVLSYSYRNK